ncbi:MAG: accessory factor UbiK family protein, partial [Alphaproteobacteria bacterium]
MQTSNRLLDDLAKVASGAASSLAGLKDDAQGLVRQQMQRLLDDADLVHRDEFEAIKAVAAK